MDPYVTGAIIRRLREDRGMTQTMLADMLKVSDKTVSKWETGKGYPDITLLQPLASALCVSVTELLSGFDVRNTNTSANMMRAQIYVCPVCGNILCSVGQTAVTCHGIALPPLIDEPADALHTARVDIVEDEYFVSLDHDMTREHHISFIAAFSDNGLQLEKLYPEGPAEACFKISRTRKIFLYCNRDGLFRVPFR